jgi:hypothetical protein
MMDPGPIAGWTLEACGAVALVLGGWRSYALAREAIAPLADDGDPTRTALEATRPLLSRSRVRTFARRVGCSVGWLVVAMYGLYLLLHGQALLG